MLSEKRDQEAQGAVLKQPRLEDSEPNCTACSARNIPNLSSMCRDLKIIFGPVHRPKKHGEHMSEEGEKSRRRLLGEEVKF